MSGVFLEERQKALEKFLCRLVAHPYFSFDQDIKIFLTASDEVGREGSRKEGRVMGWGGGGGGGGGKGSGNEAVCPESSTPGLVCAGFCSSLE